MLTASADTGAAFTGTEKGDVFKVGETLISSGYYDVDGSGEPDTFVNQYTSHLNSLDVLDGGAGKDTLNVETEGAIATVTANISNIETINLKSGSTVTFDTTTYTGVETLNVTKATTSATLDAAATTDVNVSGITTGAVSVDGGKNVNVTVADTGTNTTITLTAGVDTIYGLGGADTINVVTNTTAIAAVSTDGKSIATTGMEILYVDGSTTVNLTAALGTEANYDTVTDIAAGNNISTTVTATTVNQVHGLYDFATGIFTSSATAALDTASTTDVAASMFLYATLDGTTANQGIIIVGSTGNATIAAGVLDLA